MKVSLVLSFQRKNFFFEKKKQKTSNPCGRSGATFYVAPERPWRRVAAFFSEPLSVLG
jgi:hypothetical protein